MRAAAVAAATALLAAATPASAEVDWLAQRVLNITHQGAENEAPSNTMYAYERALRLGADMLELDVHTTADGHVVVLHDGTVDRTTNGSGAVDEMTLAEIQKLDAGFDFVPGLGTETGHPAGDYRFRGVRTGNRKPPPGFRPRDFRIPTLEEVLLEYPTVPTNIEIKGAADSDVASFLRNAEHVAAVLNRLGRSEGIIVVSFNDAATQRFHELAPDVDLAPGTAGVAAFKAAGVPPGPGNMVAFQTPIEFGGVGVTDRDFVQQAHDGGYAVHVWTINDEPTMREILDWGVDGIMSAESMRVEQVLCADRVARVPRPASFPGRHCNYHRASIACRLRPSGAAEQVGRKRIRVRIVRYDEFPSRCAGLVRVRLAPGAAARTAGLKRRALLARARVSFGKLPPEEGGPASREVVLRVRSPARPLVAAGILDHARVRVRPYLAFAAGARLPIR